MLVTHLDLHAPIVRAMVALLGYLHCPFQLVPTSGSCIPRGCIELGGPKIFVAGVTTPDANDIPTIEALVRASGHDCILVRLDGPLKGPPIWIDVIQFGSTHLHYHAGLDLYERPGGQSLLIDTRRSAISRPHGLRMTRHGLMPTGELPPLRDIEGLRNTDLSLRRIIWGDPMTPLLNGWPEER